MSRTRIDDGATSFVSSSNAGILKRA